MKLIILSVDQIYANKVLNKLIDYFGKDIELIILSTSLLSKKPLLRSLWLYVIIAGYYYIMVQITKLLIYKVVSQISPIFPNSKIRNKFYPFKSKAKKLNIDIIRTDNINNKKLINIIRQKKPDILVSVYFNQILSKINLAIPKKGTINIHPAYLPNYKGISPAFWVLSNNEKSTGVSIHYIDKGIDTGKIIRQKKYTIHKNDTEDSLYWNLTMIGIPLLIKSIQDIKKDNIHTVNNKQGNYYSIPSRNAVKLYKRDNRPFFNLSEFIFNS